MSDSAAVFTLDARLREDCFVLGRLELCQLLLLNNSAVPWFVLVPECDVTEIWDLSAEGQQQLWAEVAQVAEFVRTSFATDKLNLGAIGNVVSQLHVHLMGRRKDDFCWPDVTWGVRSDSVYTDEALAVVKDLAINRLQLKEVS